MLVDFFKKYINNKYFYSALAFVVWMFFFDSDNFREQIRLSQRINDLEKQKSYYSKEIEKNKSALKALQYDTAKLEDYARERYFMKKNNEDIYLIVRDTTNN
ncbi:MAG: septum formation initiator family protein [Bacteroidales bacterium]|nr:septum formation initiator family protein [Bacteroidales bacterium]